MITLAIFLVATFFTAYIGNVVVRALSFGRIQSESLSESYLIGFLLGQLLLIKAATLLGLFGWINLEAIVYTLLLFLVLALALDWRHDWAVMSRYPSIANIRHKASRYDVTWLTIVVLFIGILALAVDTSPPRHADMLRYHLEYSNYILSSGSLPFVPHNQLALATDAELLFSMIIMGFGVEYVKLIVYVNLIFCIYAASVYFESFGATIKKYAIGFFVASPILFLASTIVKPDVIQLLYFVTSLFLMNRLYQKFSVANLVLIAVFLGEVLALKWTGVIPILSLVLYLLFLYIVKAESRKTLLYLVLAIGIATVVIPMYWYLRNYLATGNPIWPILSHLFMTDDGSLLYEVSTHGSSRSGEIAAYGFFGYLLYTFFLYKPSLLGGIGVSYYLSLPLAMYSKMDRRITYYVAFVVIYIMVWYFAQASFRHLIWTLPFLAVIASSGYVRSKTWRNGVVKYINKLIVLLVFFQLVFIAIYSTLFVKYSIGVVDGDAYYATTPNYHTFQKVEHDIGNPLKKVLVIVPGSEIYYLNQAHIDGNSRFSAIVDYKKIKGADDLADRLRELEVDYILFDDELIQSDIYADLRKIISGSSNIVSQYESKIIKNRLLGKSINKYLTLVKLSR